MKIKILGTGCKKCNELDTNVRECVKLYNLDIAIEKINEINDILDFGVMTIPALVIDEKVVSVGKVLSSETIKTIIDTQ
ncbi:MAG: thioredoxin family protein [Candidatus Cloacimonetes bacterium]|jgi:small redox-active disulfide protein 2|nr:thioredoxin family protein [Candidatus Cloacimonadota bacterium]MBT6993454.1 thioredoxin family protein [Candidatus Cloacimonadota bacterium]MBT7469552.1 thioredoxin family protein [Candidatus Cloacimonadota bacterium]